MKRQIVHIDEEKCNGCGLCVDACQEGALQLVDGKARLVSESYCDGLGNCLPECPTGAITIEEREVSPFDAAAVEQQKQEAAAPPEQLPCGCPGTSTRVIERESHPRQHPAVPRGETAASRLRQWPCQLRLVPVNAPYLEKAALLVAADCTAYAYAGIHQDFMGGRITLIGCPKLDNTDYSEKLTEILKTHELKSITVLRMEVPCCGGIAEAVKRALTNSGQVIPWRIVTIGTDGSILEE